MPEDKETPLSATPERLSPESIKHWVDAALARYKTLAGIDGNSAHWASQLTAIMMRIEYEPPVHLLANQGLLPVDAAECPTTPGYNDLIHKHVSRELLNDLEATLELEEQRVTVGSLSDVNGQRTGGEVYETEDGGLSYLDHENQADMSDADEKPTSWGSW